MNLTIFISTYNRPQFVDCLFFYFYKFKFDCNFVVIDGSEKKFKKLNIKIINKYKNSFNGKIIYKHTDKQLSKIYTLASKVKTKYCLLTNDDDLPGKKFIIESIDFLNKNKNFITTNGYIATSDIKFYNNDFSFKNYKFSHYPRIDIKDCSPDKRYLQFNYKEGFAFTVYRSSDFKNIFKVIKNCCKIIKDPIKKIEHIVSFRLLTIAFTIYNIFKGNIKISNKLMMTKINHQFNQSSNINYYEPLGGLHVMDFHKNNTKYLDTLVEQLGKTLGNRNIKNIRNFVYLHVYVMIDEILPRFFYKTHKEFDPKPFSLKRKINILKFFPQYYYFRIKNIFNKFNLFDNLKFNYYNSNEIKHLKRLKKKKN